MNFISIEFPENYEYSSDSDNQPIEFYLDILPISKNIYLKLGYFSSSAIRLLAYGFATFIYRGGCIKIITNHYFYQKDKELLNINNKVDFNDKKWLDDFDWLTSSLTSETEHFFNCLKYLVNQGRLEIIPVMLMPDRMSHYKQGIFIDNNDNSIFMDGSCNFSAQGIIGNGENISVYRSWGSEFEAKKVNEKKEDVFKIISKESDKYIYLSTDQIIDTFTTIGAEKSLEELLSEELNLIEKIDINHRNLQIEKYNLLINNIIKYNKIKIKLSIPSWLNYKSGEYSHQGEAVDAWFNNGKKGILSIATGGGKTITALIAATLLMKEVEQLLVVISVPTKALMNQWEEDVISFAVLPNNTVGKIGQIISQEITDSLRKLRLKNSNVEVIIITHDAMSSGKYFSGRQGVENVDSLLIVDEVHNIGSQLSQKNFPTNFKYKIGLSATYKRQFDDEGTKFLIETFGDVVYEFGLDKAIGKCLVNYNYFAHIVYLTAEEEYDFIELTKQIKRLSFAVNDADGSAAKERWQSLCLKRRKLIESAENKIAALKGTLPRDASKILRTLIFCTDKNPNQLEQVNAYLNELSVNFHQITAEETSSNPKLKSIIESFAKDELQVLTSKRVLDEGFNVPQTETAYLLASNTVVRQWTQRLGRVLRLSDRTNKQIATIHDYIVLPIIDANADPDLKALLRSEADRILFFSEYSNNYMAADGGHSAIEKIINLIQG